MRVLCINAGSSSVKIALYEVAAEEKQSNGTTPAAVANSLRGVHANAQLIVSKSLKNNEDPVESLQHFVAQEEKEEAAHAAKARAASASASSVSSRYHPHPIRLIVHRIVHGGPLFHAPTLLDDASITKLETLNSLAPLHNPPALRWVHAGADAFCKGDLGKEVRQIGIFDTSFFHDLPLEAQTCAIPSSLAAKHSIRRYGFHGIAHKDMSLFAAEHVQRVVKGGRMITLQLGSGASAAAMLDGHPIETSMGFTPLEGLVMATRSGDVDPALLTWLQKHEPSLKEPEKLDDLLYHKSGLLGLSSGESNDMRHLEASLTPGAKLAIDVFVHRLVKQIGAYVALLGGLDTLVFGGGIGENSVMIRSRVLTQLGKFLPLEWDPELSRSKKHNEHALISTAASKITVWVVAVDEAALMLRDALKLTQPDGQQSRL
jgi:acetate kinase